MRGALIKLIAAASLALGNTADASANAARKAQIQTLPPLREQARIVDAWTEERKALIPGILQKYNVDAWIVSSTQTVASTPLSSPNTRMVLFVTIIDSNMEACEGQHNAKV